MTKCPICNGKVTQEYSGDYDVYLCEECFEYFGHEEKGECRK